MPIDYRIDHEQRLVVARCTGTLTDPEVFAYQQEAWSRPDVTGYHELVDMSGVEHIAVPSTRRVADLANLAAAMDAGKPPSKMAIYAPEKLAYGLGRMFQVYRELAEHSARRVGVFRSLEAALEWLRQPDDAD